MRIQLKQFEIENALEGYLAKQGIAVAGKAVTMDFTAGRKNKGISVEVVIEDLVKPSLAEQFSETQYEHEVLAPAETSAPFPESTETTTVANSTEVVTAAVEEAKPAASPSLFG